MKEIKVKQTLFETPYSFIFFKAVHLLEGYNPGRRIGKQLSPKDDPVRFRVKPGFAFPASDIQELNSSQEDSAPLMTINHMGLIGPNGVLPHWYNTHGVEKNYKKDYAFTDFLDMFHHRLVSLFYLAWKKYRITENYRWDGTEPTTRMLSCFIGMGDNEHKADPEFGQAARKRLLYFTGLASRTIPTPSAIETIVSNATGVPVHVDQFVKRMIPIQEEDQTCLGRANNTLKADALCGRRYRDISSFFWVELGPMSWKDYLPLQPRSQKLALVKKLVTYIVGLEYEFKIRLIIKGPEIPSLQLGGGESGDPILGRTVLLKRSHRPYKKNIRVREIG